MNVDATRRHNLENWQLPDQNTEKPGTTQIAAYERPHEHYSPVPRASRVQAQEMMHQQNTSPLEERLLEGLPGSQEQEQEREQEREQSHRRRYHHRGQGATQATNVGQGAAEEIGMRLNSRDIAVLRTVAGLGVATQEQLQRVFFGSEQAARLSTDHLRKLRMLMRLEASRDQITYAVGNSVGNSVRSAVGNTVGKRPRASNVALALDYNGYYFLKSLGAPEVLGWDPDRAGSVTGQFIHKLCLSELWSYLAAASRATYEYIYVPSISASYGANGVNHPFSMSLHWIREGARFRGVPSDHKALAAMEAGKRYPVAVKPDALAVLQVRVEPFRYDKSRNPYAAPILKDTWTRTYAALSRAMDDADNTGSAPPGLPSRHGKADMRRGNQYTEAHSAWRYALLFDTPDDATPDKAKDDSTPLEPHSRTLFIEVETGNNSPDDMAAKIKEYNALTKGVGKQVCEQLYQRVPRILVVCRKQSRVLRTAEQWFHRYEFRAATSVVITSLEQLASVEAARGRHGLVLDRCWLDVFGHEAGPTAQPKWLSLPDAVGVQALLQSASEYMQAHPDALPRYYNRD